MYRCDPTFPDALLAGAGRNKFRLEKLKDEINRLEKLQRDIIERLVPFAATKEAA